MNLKIYVNTDTFFSIDMADRNAHVPLQVIAVELVEVNDPVKMKERPREEVCGRQT